MSFKSVSEQTIIQRGSQILGHEFKYEEQMITPTMTPNDFLKLFTDNIKLEPRGIHKVVQTVSCYYRLPDPDFRLKIQCRDAQRGAWDENHRAVTLNGLHIRVTILETKTIYHQRLTGYIDCYDYDWPISRVYRFIYKQICKII